jgi:hypothetical protein
MTENSENSMKKTYKEALLTPSTTPTNSPSNNIFILTNHQAYSMGIIDKRMKWYLNKINEKETCVKCHLNIDSFEWNSFYIIYAERYINILDQNKLKIYNNLDSITDDVYCDVCRDKLIEEFKINKKKDLKEMSKIDMLKRDTLKMESLII